MICGSSCWAWSGGTLQPRRRRRALLTPCLPGSSTPLGLSSIRARELLLNLPGECLNECSFLRLNRRWKLSSQDPKAALPKCWVHRAGWTGDTLRGSC